MIEPQRYFHLEAVAQDGRHWQVDRTIPEMGGSFRESGFQYLVGGLAREMWSTESLSIPVTNFHLTLVFFAEAKIPCNATTETTTVVGGEHKQTSMVLDVARFTTGHGKFRVSKREGMVVVKIVANSPFPPHFESRFIEALMFVLAKPLSWNLIVRLEGDTETVRVRGKPHVIDARLPGRPVVGSLEDIDTTGVVWKLFDKYLTLVCSHTDDDFHPCSRHLFAVLQGSTGGMSAWGLTLGVAVEGIAKAMFPVAGSPMAGMREVVAPLKTYCLEWGGFPAGEVGDSIQKRLPGMIDQLLSSSAKDRLHELAKSKAIDESHIKSWSKLRNATAHGVTPGSDDVQKVLDLCYQVTVLMYHLIFKAVG